MGDAICLSPIPSYPPFLPPQSTMGRVQALCSLLQSLLVSPQSSVDISMATDKLHPLICTCFLFCYVWCLGGNLVEKSMDAFDTFCRDLFSEQQDVKVRNKLCLGIVPSKEYMHCNIYLQIPGAADLYSYYVDCETRRLENWEKIIPSFTYNPEVHVYMYNSVCNEWPTKCCTCRLPSLIFWFLPLTRNGMDFSWKGYWMLVIRCSSLGLLEWGRYVGMTCGNMDKKCSCAVIK